MEVTTVKSEVDHIAERLAASVKEHHDSLELPPKSAPSPPELELGGSKLLSYPGHPDLTQLTTMKRELKQELLEFGQEEVSVKSEVKWLADSVKKHQEPLDLPPKSGLSPPEFKLPKIKMEIEEDMSGLALKSDLDFEEKTWFPASLMSGPTLPPPPAVKQEHPLRLGLLGTESSRFGYIYIL